MEKATLTVEYDIFSSGDDLLPADRELLEKAREAVTGSYAPYSRYHVGAAVRLANGVIVTGSNQENVSFPAGLCAERVALFAASSAYPGVAMTDLAISAASESFPVSEPVPPCGICRQVMMECENRQQRPLRVILGGQTGKVYILRGMQNLLPLAFHEKGLVR